MEQRGKITPFLTSNLDHLVCILLNYVPSETICATWMDANKINEDLSRNIYLDIAHVKDSLKIKR